jgi:hypothetical protein
MYVPVIIRRASGRKVKTFALDGAHELDEVIFWIWRDLVLTMLASPLKRVRDAVPEMLEDIQEVAGWAGLERMLCGGRHSEFSLPTR